MQEFGQEIETRRLTGAIGADKGVDGAFADAKVDVRYSRKITEVFRQSARLQDRLGGRGARTGVKRGHICDSAHDAKANGSTWTHIKRMSAS